MIKVGDTVKIVFSPGKFINHQTLRFANHIGVITNINFGSNYPVDVLFQDGDSEVFCIDEVILVF